MDTTKRCLESNWQKRVDWSVFRDGSTIPIDFHDRFYKANSSEALKRNVQLLIEDAVYNAMLRHDEGKMSDCFKKFLRNRLSLAYRYTLPNIQAPNDFVAYLDFIATGAPYVYRVNIVEPTSNLGKDEYVINSLDEYSVEMAIDTAQNDRDFITKLSGVAGNASVETKEAIVKIRKYRHAVIRELKKRYEGRCQLCEWTSVTDYNVDVSQGHHISGFLVSKDNTPSNIAILCPRCHCLVHALGATLDRDRRSFVGKDGQTMPLRIDHHLLP